MEKKKENILNRGMAPYLFGLYFLVYQSAESFYSFNLIDSFRFIIVYGLIIFSINFILDRVFVLKNTVLSILVFAVLFLFADYFRYGLRDMLSIFNFRNRHYFVLIFSITILLVYLEYKVSSKNTGLYRRLNKFYNIFLVFLILIALGNGFYRLRLIKVAETETRKEIKEGTGIVWILMDEYPSSETLHKYFNYSNPLDSFLTKRHFVLLDTINSRYSSTLFSVNSIFNYDDSIRPKSFESSIYTLGRSKWAMDINNGGNQFRNLDFLTIGPQNKLMDLFYFPDTFEKQLLYGSLIFNALATKRIGEIDQYNTLVYKNLDSILIKDPDRYKMIWAHFLIPHMPYSRNSNGLLQENNGVAFDAKTAKYRYINYLDYGNHLIEKLLKDNPVLTNKIVIISGDHGARFPFVERNDWRKPYCSVYFPNAFDTVSLKKLKYISQLPGLLSNY